MDPNTPAWAIALAAGIVAVCGAGYGIVKLAAYAGDQWLAWRSKWRKQRAEEETEDRRAVGETWAAVVARLTQEVKELTARLDDAEGKAQRAYDGWRECHSERRSIARLLQFLVAWGESQGMNMPDDVRDEIKRVIREENQPGSGPHAPLAGGDER